MKQLFKGHPELTRGFAAFLPKEYKIDVQGDEDEGEMEDMSGGGAGGAGGLNAQQAAAIQAQQQAAAAAVQMQQAQQVQQAQQAQQREMVRTMGGGGAGGAAAGAAGNEAVGEEHARVYVKKIKNRFVNQPHIYKSFLDILHTFHREKHSIQEVYTQVAALFRDHPDLLGEFAHFLPDPNAQMNQAQQQAMHQQASMHHYEDHHHHGGQAHGGQQHMGQAHGHGHHSAGGQIKQQPARNAGSRNARGGGVGGDLASVASAGARGNAGPVSGNAQRQHQGAGHVGAAGGAGGNGNALGGTAPGMGADGTAKDRSHGTFEELMHFFKLKQVLPQNDYEEMLKLLSMYNADVLSKTELYYMVRDLLRHQDMELLEWFRKFMQLEDLKDDEAHGYIADYDWSTSEKLGPSYRATPRHWEQWKCTGRTGNTLCTEVLNDSWISVPTGTEEGSFKSSRKNQYEELLFKCEDDRFELDLLVEGNVSAIRQLELLLASFRTLSPSALATFQLNESDLHVLTVKAIRRVYGPRADEFIKMIMGKPAVAIPVVLGRLKAKDTEWNLARRDWNVLWKQIFKKNYHKQLDHRSTVFKQEEKKMLTSKALFAELRRASSSAEAKAAAAAAVSSISTRSSGADKIHDPTANTNAAATVAAEDGSRMDIDDKPNGGENGGPSVATSGSSSINNHGEVSAANGSSSSSSSSSAVGSPTLSYIISQPNLFADIKKLLMLTFAAQMPKVDIVKFNAIWNSLICAFFHVDPNLKSVLGDTVIDENGDEVSATGNDMVVDEENVSASATDANVDASATANAASVPAAAANATTATTNNAAAVEVKKEGGVMESTNKPISTELASQPATHNMLFLGNDSFYLLFRYLQILYDRMAEAWSFSEEFPPVHHTPIVEIDPKHPVTETVPAAINAVHMDGQAVIANAKKEAAAHADNPTAAIANTANTAASTTSTAAANTTTSTADATSTTTTTTTTTNNNNNNGSSAMDQEGNGAASTAGSSSTSAVDNAAATAAPLSYADAVAANNTEKDSPTSSSSEGEAIIYEEKQGPESSLTRYHGFLKNAEALIGGKIEQQTFEERCRHAFGISCFPLFTIDKILLLLAKQFHAVNSDEMSEKLAGLYQYEVSRNMLGGFTDAVYLSNCREVLSHEKHAYVFTFDASPDSLILGVTEVDLGHPSFGLEHNEELSAYINKLATNESVLAKKAQRQAQLAASSGSVKTEGGMAVDPSSSSSTGANGATPFLRRNVEQQTSGEVSGAPMPQGASNNSGEIVIQNELGVKVVPGSFKLRFVGGTEDSLQRQGRNTQHSSSDDKIQLEALQQNSTLPNPMDPK